MRGTVNVSTIEPFGSGVSERLYGRYSSAEISTAARVEASRTGRLSFHLGGSLKTFGDLRAGGDASRQPRTGYEELDGDCKVVYEASADRRWIAAYQRVSLEDA